MTEHNTKTYRFNFSMEFTQILYDFAKIHQFDSRIDFKESFTTWITENQDIIDNEILYLETKGYNGDIKSKIYKSARYYFRKKPIVDDDIPTPTTTTTTPTTAITKIQKRKKYIGNSIEFIHLMDEHLCRFSIKPDLSFNNFVEIYKLEIQEEINTLRRIHPQEFTDLSDPDILSTKIKKTFKNRYCLKNNK